MRPTRLHVLMFVVTFAAGCLAERAPVRVVNDPPPGHPHHEYRAPPPPPPPPPGGSVTTATGSGSTTTTQKAPPKNAAACPATYGDGKVHCGPDTQRLGCSYPKGSCMCTTRQWCGGEAPPANRPVEWVCRPKYICGEVGTPCTGHAKCSPPCCGTEVACVNGTWTARVIPCKA